MPVVRLRGLGLVSAYGQGVDRAAAGMIAGRSAITPLTLFTVPFQDRIQVNQLDHTPYPPGEAGALALLDTAVREALSEAGLTTEDLRDTALVVGTSGFLFAAEAEYRHRQAQQDHPPTRPALRAPGYLTQEFAAQLGMQGPIMTLSTACSSSANALLVAGGFLRRGEARRALVIGVEGLSAVTLNGFQSLMLLDPEGCRPFDAERRGMQLGEAAAVVLLEAEPDPAEHGDTLLGGANLCDIHHVTSASPDGSAMRTVMEMALADAGVAPDQVTLIKAHGTGSPDNDMAEAAAMRALWGESLPPFTAIKRYLGHTLGACGVVELAALIGCLRAGAVPSACGCQRPDPELRITPLRTSHPAQPGIVMFNYFGFGGNYASFLIRHG
jgi:3-oxoacyl-(acyl-carrier-protein) synthase